MFIHSQKKPDPGTVTIMGFKLRKNPLNGSQELEFVASDQVFATMKKATSLLGGAFRSMWEKFAHTTAELVVMTRDDFDKMVAAIDNGSPLRVERVGSYFINPQKKPEGKISPGGKVTVFED